MAERANDTPTGFQPDETYLANFGRRLGALLIDWALCLVLSSLYADPRSAGAPAVIVLIILNTVGIGLFGRTPGMVLAGIRCISIADGTPIGLGKAFLRAILLALLIPALIMDASRRGLHDRAAGSVVAARTPR